MWLFCRTSMFKHSSKSYRSPGWSVAGLLASLMLTAKVESEALPLPVLKPVTVEVDITNLPASEQAALAPILRAARDMDAVYMQQVWSGTRAMIDERRGAVACCRGGAARCAELLQGTVGAGRGAIHRRRSAQAADRRLLPLWHRQG